MLEGGGGGGGATGLLNKGGGGVNRFPGLVLTKQQAVEFSQVLASKLLLLKECMCLLFRALEWLCVQFAQVLLVAILLVAINTVSLPRHCTMLWLLILYRWTCANCTTATSIAWRTF